MKKEYKKPELFFDSFELSMSIAAGCETKIDTHSSGQCGINYGGQVIFLDGIAGCDKKTSNDGDYGICYHLPIETNNLFNS